MSSLNIDKKQILFDYCIGLTTKEQSEKAHELITENKEAAILYSKMKAVFMPLEIAGIENCPEDLVEKTFLRINNLTSPNKGLNELLKAEQNKKTPIKIGFLSNFSEVAGIAAAILLITGILVPTFGYARQRYWRQQCGMGMKEIFSGFRNYMSDHDNRPPSVARADGANWWKIGNEKESNTGHMYLLVTKEYVRPEKFICPSKKNWNRPAKDSVKFKSFMVNYKNYRDFPDRRCVTYSFPIVCQKPSGKLSCRKALMADSNPIFEQLPEDQSQTFYIELKKEQLHVNSNNHKNRGQNVLFGDGRVEFLKTRQISTDDLFTLQDTDVYKGNEIPSCSTDQFLAP
ncbi:MAG: hypothetical protein JW787_03285 [Sedimentisphaerales bacterium]|nr:hypothetical protein [Sedimentisphaerales bacterium]